MKSGYNNIVKILDKIDNSKNLVSRFLPFNEKDDEISVEIETKGGNNYDIVTYNKIKDCYSIKRVSISGGKWDFCYQDKYSFDFETVKQHLIISFKLFM